nr:unnamed protein product [Spirometra erinaceieuropaei]
MGLDSRYDRDQRRSLSAIALKHRQSASLDYADADNSMEQSAIGKLPITKRTDFLTTRPSSYPTYRRNEVHSWVISEGWEGVSTETIMTPHAIVG